MMSIANQPIEQYAQLATTQALGPAQIRTQQALANQAAMQAAQAQQDIQSRVDPMAYAQRQIRMQMANQRLGQLAGVDPSMYNFRAPGAYSVPGTADIPPLSALQGNAADIAANIATASVNKAGANPRLNVPQGTNLRYPTMAQSYF
jgi:hypothetical protein